MYDDMYFEWDDDKNKYNQKIHRVSFELAKKAFEDPNMLIVEDTKHSHTEKRLYCIGKVGGDILMVRFTIRKSKVRIFGAGYWRQGKKIYEKTYQIH